MISTEQGDFSTISLLQGKQAPEPCPEDRSPQHEHGKNSYAAHRCQHHHGRQNRTHLAGCRRTAIEAGLPHHRPVEGCGQAATAQGQDDKNQNTRNTTAPQFEIGISQEIAFRIGIPIGRQQRQINEPPYPVPTQREELKDAQHRLPGVKAMRAPAAKK